MRFDQDYRRALRAGFYCEKNILLKENDAAVIVALAIGAAVMMIMLAAIFQSCGLAGGVR